VADEAVLNTVHRRKNPNPPVNYELRKVYFVLKILFVTEKSDHDPDPHWFSSLNPDQHQGKKLDPDPD
jgi:hypothetical protein